MIGVFKQEDALGKRLVIVFKGLPCSWGKCNFCPFALEQGNLKQVIETNRRILEDAEKILEKEHIDRITIFNGGSFYELPLDTIIRLNNITRNRIVDIETRPEFIDYNIVVNTINILGSRRLVIRIGFEVIDEYVRNKILNKGIPQQEIYRIANLRKQLMKNNIPAEIIAYVLFGIEGISEDMVIKSVEEFNKLFDGVIAIKYKKYLPKHPRQTSVSEKLIKYLKENTLLVDMGEEEYWEISKETNS